METERLDRQGGCAFRADDASCSTSCILSSHDCLTLDIMLISKWILCITLARTAAGLAAPAPAPTSFLVERQSCNNVVVNVLKKLGGVGSTFCSNYLKVPATTTLKATSTPLS